MRRAAAASPGSQFGVQDKNEKLKQQLQAASAGGQGSEARLADKEAQIHALQVCPLSNACLQAPLWLYLLPCGRFG